VGLVKKCNIFLPVIRVTEAKFRAKWLPVLSSYIERDNFAEKIQCRNPVGGRVKGGLVKKLLKL
jgi:hypothetical protein